MIKKPTTYLERLDEIPPPLCRLIARTRNNPPRILKMTEIAQAAGLTLQKVAWIAKQKSFAKVKVEEADRFRLGCGITPQNEFRHREYIVRNFRRQTCWSYLFRHAPVDDHRKRFIERILKRL